MSVSFKVFLTNEGTSDPPEVRRFGIDKEVVTNFSYLQEKLQQVYPVLKGRVFNVFWQDTDGDKVKISCDEELIIALTELQAEVRKLYVSLKSGFSAAPNDNIHIGVICDGCQGSIAGIRYKCLDCVNYDLCQKCENKGIHPEHNMIRMPKPTIFRPHFFPRLNRIFNRHSCADRRYQPFKVPVNVESGDEASGNDCHKKCRKMKRSDSEQSSDDCEQKKRKHHKHHNKHPHKHHHHPRGGDHPGHHQNWSDLVYGMMGWDSENQDQNTEAAHIKYLNAIGKTVANVLDPFGVDVEIEIKPKQSNNDKKTEKENENNNKEGQEGNNEDKAKENQKVRFEIPEDNQMNELSNFLSQQKLSESTQDGWTIFNTEENEPQQQQINPQNIAAALSALTNAATTSAENNAASASAQTNAATTSAQNNAVASAPVVPNIYPQLPEKQPTAPSHPNPIIADALDKMLAMGFTNDGGWLTQLVEAKNGDIYKVLDILQPHTKK